MQWLKEIIYGTEEQAQREVDQYSHDLAVISSFVSEVLAGERDQNTMTLVTNHVLQQVRAIDRIKTGETFTVPSVGDNLQFTKNSDSSVTVTLQKSNIRK